MPNFFADQCKVIGFAKGDKNISQGHIDADLFFIVAGSVDVYVNERTVAVRCKGLHVGEMALLDDTVKRSADVIAKKVYLLHSEKRTTLTQENELLQEITST